VIVTLTRRRISELAGRPRSSIEYHPRDFI
jgi:hypothetical protein